MDHTIITRVNEKLKEHRQPPLHPAFTLGQMQSLIEGKVVTLDKQQQQTLSERVTAAQEFEKQKNKKPGYWQKQPADGELLRQAAEPVVGYHVPRADTPRFVFTGPRDMAIGEINAAFIEVAKERADEHEKEARKGNWSEEKLVRFGQSMSDTLIMIDSVRRNSSTFGAAGNLTVEQKDDVDRMLNRLEKTANRVPENTARGQINQQWLLGAIRSIEDNVEHSYKAQHGRGTAPAKPVIGPGDDEPPTPGLMDNSALRRALADFQVNWSPPKEPALSLATRLPGDKQVLSAGAPKTRLV